MIIRSPFVVLRNDNDYFIYFITLTVGIKKRGVAPRSNVSYLSVCQINQVAATDPGVCMRELRKKNPQPIPLLWHTGHSNNNLNVQSWQMGTGYPGALVAVRKDAVTLLIN